MIGIKDAGKLFLACRENGLYNARPIFWRCLTMAFLSRFTSWLLGILGLAQGLDWLAQGQYFGLSATPKLWALTTATFLAIIHLSMFVCMYSQKVLKDEIERCAAAKSKLENQVLNNRRTSSKKV